MPLGEPWGCPLPVPTLAAAPGVPAATLGVTAGPQGLVLCPQLQASLWEQNIFYFHIPAGMGAPCQGEPVFWRRACQSCARLRCASPRCAVLRCAWPRRARRDAQARGVHSSELGGWDVPGWGLQAPAAGCWSPCPLCPHAAPVLFFEPRALLCCANVFVLAGSAMAEVGAWQS